MSICCETMWSVAIGWTNMNTLDVFNAGLRSLFCQGYLDSQFLILSESAQRSFIPVFDKMHSFKSMSEA